MNIKDEAPPLDDKVKEDLAAAGIKEKPKYPKKPVTAEELDAKLEQVVAGFGKIVEDYKDTMHTEMKNVTAEIANILDKHATQINALTKVINEGGQQQEQAAQPAQAGAVVKPGITIGGQTIGLDEILPLVKPYIERKLTGDTPEDPLQPYANLISKMINRQAVKIATKQVQQGLQRGLLFPDEVESMLGDKIGSGVNDRLT